MKKAGRAVFHAVYFVGLLLIVLLPVDRYKWMSEMSPDISVDAIEDVAGNSALLVFLLLIGIVAVQFILLIKAQRKLLTSKLI